MPSSLPSPKLVAGAVGTLVASVVVSVYVWLELAISCSAENAPLPAWCAAMDSVGTPALVVVLASVLLLVRHAARARRGRSLLGALALGVGVPVGLSLLLSPLPGQ